MIVIMCKCLPVCRGSDSMMARLEKTYSLDCLGWNFYVCFSAHRGSAGAFRLLQYSSGVVWQPRDLQMPQHVISVELPYLLHYKLLYVIYLLPVMIHEWVRRPPHMDRTNMILPLVELRTRVGIP